MKLILFADDPNSFCCGKILKQLLETVEIKLVVFDFDKLSLNLSKTTFITFAIVKQIYKIISDVEIVRVSEIKFILCCSLILL